MKLLLDPDKWDNNFSKDELMSLLEKENIVYRIAFGGLVLREADIIIFANQKEAYTNILENLKKTIPQVEKIINRHKQLKNDDHLFNTLNEFGLTYVWYNRITSNVADQFIEELKEIK